jgi:hypothetical protein
MEKYNPFVKAVVLRMSEAHDLGDGTGANRYTLYERVKVYTAAPPDVLACVDKYIRRFYVPNVLGLAITTNHKTDGVFLPQDDRRHLVIWSDCTKEEFDEEYWNTRWRWLLHEDGAAHVAAYLMQRDLAKFNPAAPPRQTTAFFEIVNANHAPEDAEVADALDEIGLPNIVTLAMIVTTQCGAALDWLTDKRRRRSIPHRLERCGYLAVRNPGAKDGLWRIKNRRQTLYGKIELTAEQRLQWAEDYYRTHSSGHEAAGNS